VSKFNAVPDKVSIDNETKRVIIVNKSWLEKLGKQYEVIEDIQSLDTDLENNPNGFCNNDTMTDQTLLEGASINFDKKVGEKNESLESENDGINNTENNGLTKNAFDNKKDANSTLRLPNNNNNNNNKKDQVNEQIEKEQESAKNDNDTFTNSSSINSIIDNKVLVNNQPSENLQNLGDTPSESVRSVRSVMQLPKTYPCMFYSEYSTHIDFDMELPLLEKHKQQLLRLPIKCNLDKREEYVIVETK
jgi:hypothetical protein